MVAIVPKYLLAHSLQFAQNVVPLLLNHIQLRMYLINLVINIIIKLLIELVLNVLRQIVVKILVWERRLRELSEGIEVGSILERLDVHHIWELEVGWRGHHWRRVHLATH